MVERSRSVVTLRMSPWLHRGLKALAWRRKVSLNRLCLQLLEVEVQHALDEIAETGSSSLIRSTEKRNPSGEMTKHE
jgi:HicB family